MENLPVPQKIDWKKGKQDHQEIVTIEPCYPGYGTTLGTALRRVLLSSLPGAAPVAVKMKGVLHEFSTIPGIKEDVMEIILAVKKIRFKLFDLEEATLRISVNGAKEVHASDFEKNAHVEIMNPETHIATLTSPDSELELEVYIRKGRGYLPTEERDREEREIGKILIDALFSPVSNVGIKVENIRVGEMTNFERLTLTITTDGTITPEEAFTESVSILMSKLQALSGKPASTEVGAAPEMKESPMPEISQTPELSQVGIQTPNETAEEKPKKRGRKKKEETM